MCGRSCWQTTPAAAAAVADVKGLHHFIQGRSRRLHAAAAAAAISTTFRPPKPPLAAAAAAVPFARLPAAVLKPTSAAAAASILPCCQACSADVELFALRVFQTEQQAVLAGASTQRVVLHPAHMRCELLGLLLLQLPQLLCVLLLQQLLCFAGVEGVRVPFEQLVQLLVREVPAGQQLMQPDTLGSN